MWSLVPVLAKLVITTIVPMFTLSEQMYEEPLVLTITQATELIRLNSRILHNLETIEVMDSFKSKHIFSFSGHNIKICNIFCIELFCL